METVEGKSSIFRKEAIEHYQRGPRLEGELLRLAPGWTRWAYWLLLSILVTGLLYSVLGTLYEYASGPALVRVEGRTDLTVPAAGVVSTVWVQPGQRVEAGQMLVSFLSEEEQNTQARIQREFDLQLVRYLRSPSDTAARQALTALRAERELAQARLEARTLRAPFAGVVGDLRIQPGQYLASGTRALSLMESEAPVFLLAFLPGHYRPFLRPGMPLRVELDGFRYDYRELTIESVGDQIIGPAELGRYLGPDLAGAVEVKGPIVLVRAHMPSSSFVNSGQVLGYFDGMPARAEARVRTEVILMALLPGLRGLFTDDG